jgi:transposase
MKRPIFVRCLTESEREYLENGLRSSDAFVLRRCQIILASSRGQRAPNIALNIGCNEQTVRDVIKAFNARGLDALNRVSSRPHRINAALACGGAEKLRTLLHQSPRNFGKPTSLWTLKLAAEICFEQGLTPKRVSAETIRATLERLGIKWKRAKHWISSPDPEYVRKETPVIG